MAAPAKVLLFVYGTLKKGKPNHNRLGLSNQKYLGEATLEDFSLVQPGNKPYPYLVIDADGEVKGELYQVTMPTIYLLDAVERGAGYKRITVELSDGIVADTYLGISKELDKLPKFKEFE